MTFVDCYYKLDPDYGITISPNVWLPVDMSERERDRWANEVVALYVSDVDMEVDEFELLLDAAMKGETPNHPRLPTFLPLETESVWR